MRRRVVVTGLGAVGAFGAGRAALAGALTAGRPARREVDRAAGYHRAHGARQAALVPPGVLDALVPPAAARRLSPPSRFALAAARLALADANAPAGPEGGLTATVLASAFGPTSFSEKLLLQLLREGPEAASPFFFTECVANAPAAQVAIALGARGPNIALTQREAGPLLALARAADLVASGRVERALAGTVEEMPPLLHAVLDRFRALAPDDVARPFDLGRRGFVAAEGAALVLLEAEDAAAARGARPLARVAGFARGFDPGAPPADWGRDPSALAAGIVGALTMAASAPDRVGLIVAGANGSRTGDRVEALALRRVWDGAQLPPLIAPKGATGEYGGGHLAAAVLAASGEFDAPPTEFACVDPELDVVPASGGQRLHAKTVLATTCAAGGAAAALVLERA